MNQTMQSDLAIADFCRGLSLLLHAGVDVGDGMALLAADAEKDCRAIFAAVGEGIDRGLPLSEAMEETGAFPAYVTGMVGVGERTGHLEGALEGLSDFYRHMDELGQARRRALRYPVLIFSLMLLVVGVLLIKVLPIFDAVYRSLGSGLDGIAAGLLRAGELLGAALPVLAGLLAAGLLFYLLQRCLPAVGTWTAALRRRYWGDRCAGAVCNNAQFAAAFHLGLSAGLSLEESAALAGSLLADVPSAAERCRRAAQKLETGAALHEALAGEGLLSLSDARMLQLAMRSGSGEDAMADIARRSMQQAWDAMEDRLGRLEPAMVLCGSVLVGVILLAVMLPLLHILTAIG